ncbi:hypothetical protein [Woodsholea maritima]|uniref:hypothetical protein n=1 Tax=Woodsholea maritima TaxID=240237 RepID=UPI0003767B41|nr:hypothetical protein [Woodsholea maritima]
MLKRVLSFVPHIMAVLMSVVFLDSLRFKFTNQPETQTIFGLLDGWAASLGAPGLFAQTGLFSQYVIGGVELLASALLLIGILPRLHRLQAMGALAGLLVMTGAISFHLFTPLGIDPNQDGGGLFMVACMNWIFAIVLLGVFRRKEFIDFVTRFAALFAPAAKA